MKYLISLIMFLSCSGFTHAATILAVEQSEKLERVFASTASAQYRVEVMFISPRTVVDPAPESDTFKNLASVTLVLNSMACYGEIKSVLSTIRESTWKKVDIDGYPRCAFRIVDSSGHILLGVLVDTNLKLIQSGDNWYRVEGELMTKITTTFVRLANEVAAGATK